MQRSCSYENVTCSYFNDTNTIENCDLIVTGDLGGLGSQILEDLMQKQGYNLAKIIDWWANDL